jgi:hypothetical protein
VQVFNPEEPATEQNSYEIDVSVLAEQARAYQAWVQAIGDEQHIDSNIGKSNTILLLSHPILLPLPAPDQVTQSYDVEAKTLTGNWNAVENATGYLVQVVNLDENNTVVVQQQLDNSNQTSHAFDTNQFTTSGAGNYQVWVKAIGNEQYLDSAFGKAETSIPRLAAPTNVRQKSELSEPAIRTILTAEWEAVTNTSGYYAQVVNVDNENQVVEEKRLDLYLDQTLLVSFETRDFPQQQEVNYQVWVKALGDDQTLDSLFSEATPLVTRLAAPTNVTMTTDSDKTQLSANWEVVENADRYFAQVVNVDDNQSVSNLQEFIDKESPQFVSFEVYGKLPENTAANYQIWINAEKNDEQYLDSAFSKPTNRITIEAGIRPA